MRQMGTNKESRLLKTKDVARRLGVSPRTVAGWIRDGILPAVKMNNHSWRVREDDLEEFIEGQRPPA